ncbi:MAG: hypothetical protein H7Y38_02215 [Armatimonadetes bacterium]|nr:hypothetical protein [Armatimonadota bacterium]
MDWKKEAEEATQFCLQTFWDAGAKRFRPNTAKPGALPWEFMWGNGVAFSMLVGAARDNTRVYRPYLSAFFAGMEDYWGRDSRPPGYDAYPANGGSDKYYDDNAWMVLTFAEAYALTRDIRYRIRAEETLAYVLSGWDDRQGGGVCWREDRSSKNTCANAPGAVAALACAPFGDTEGRTAWAKRIVNWTRKRLQDPADGLYFDNVNAATGAVERTKWTYNTALMIRAHLDLWQVTKNRGDRDEAVRLAEAAEKAFVLPDGAFRDDALFSHLLVEAFVLLWRETKLPWLRSRAEANGAFALTRLKLPDGGYAESWRNPDTKPGQRKALMPNVATARMLWCLAHLT